MVSLRVTKDKYYTKEILGTTNDRNYQAQS